MAETLTKLAYQALQQGKALAGEAHKDMSPARFLRAAPGAPGGPEGPAGGQRRDAEEGLYPTGLLFEAPWLDWVTRYSLLRLDMPGTWSRRGERRVRVQGAATGTGRTLQQLRGNAKPLPFADGNMLAVTCVFLLHELPAEARQKVLNGRHRRPAHRHRLHRHPG